MKEKIIFWVDLIAFRLWISNGDNFHEIPTPESTLTCFVSVSISLKPEIRGSIL
jgi:hypothetical protein